MTERKKPSKTTKKTTTAPVTKKTPSKPVKKPTRAASKSSKIAVKTKKASVSETSKHLSPFKDHLQNTWAVFKRSLLTYIKIVGLGFLLMIVLVIAGVLLSLPLIFTGSTDIFRSPTAVQIISGSILVLYGLAAAVIAYAFFLLMPIASIYILENDNKLGLKELYAKSRPLLFPYFIASIIVAFLVTGGWAVFILPGMLFTLLFSFVSYVVVLEGKRGKAALQRSYELVRSRFWEIIIRLIALQAFIFIVSYVFDEISAESDLFSLLSIVFSVLAGWFSQVYMYLLYKEVRTFTPATHVGTIKWVWIISLIGWAIILILIGAVAFGFMQLPSIEDSIQMMGPPPENA